MSKRQFTGEVLLRKSTVVALNDSEDFRLHTGSLDPDTGIISLYLANSAGEVSETPVEIDVSEIKSENAERILDSFTDRHYVTFNGDGRVGPYPLDFVPDNLRMMEVLVDGVDNTYGTDYSVVAMPTAGSGFGLQFEGVAPSFAMLIKVRYSVAIENQAVPMNFAKPATLDAAGIQAAADYVGSLGGGHVVLGSDEYVLTSNAVGIDEGTAVILDVQHSNICFVGAGQTKLVPASNRVEMFANVGASNLQFDGFFFDNSANGVLQYQVKGQGTGPNQGIAGHGNGANCAIRQYKGAGLTVKNSRFKSFLIATQYHGDVDNDNVLSGDVVYDNVVFDDYGMGLLANQPRSIRYSNITDIDCVQALNGNNTDGLQVDTTVTSNDPGHGIYVANRAGARPLSIVVFGVLAIRGESSSVRVRKGVAVSVSSTTHQDCERFVNVENCDNVTVTGVSGKMVTSTFANQSAIQVVDCANYNVSNFSIDLTDADGWAVRVNERDGGFDERNENGRVSNGVITGNYSISNGKAPIIISQQYGTTVEDIQFRHTGLVVGSRAIVDFVDSHRCTAKNLSKLTPDGVDDTKLVNIREGSTNTTVKWSESDLDQTPNADTVNDGGTDSRIFRDGVLSGTFTPTVEFVTNGDFVPAYNAAATYGTWRKAGGYVTVDLSVAFDANAYTTAAGDLVIPLTFAAKAGLAPRYGGYLSFHQQIDTGSTIVDLTPVLSDGSALLKLRQNSDAGGGTHMGTGNIPASTSGVTLTLSITYPYEE